MRLLTPKRRILCDRFPRHDTAEQKRRASMIELFCLSELRSEYADLLLGGVHLWLKLPV